jgi:hypothetical protein
MSEINPDEVKFIERGRVESLPKRSKRPWKFKDLHKSEPFQSGLFALKQIKEGVRALRISGISELDCAFQPEAGAFPLTVSFRKGCFIRCPTDSDTDIVGQEDWCSDFFSVRMASKNQTSNLELKEVYSLFGECEWIDLIYTTTKWIEKGDEFLLPYSEDTSARESAWRGLTSSSTWQSSSSHPPNTALLAGRLAENETGTITQHRYVSLDQ